MAEKMIVLDDGAQYRRMARIQKLIDAEMRRNGGDEKAAINSISREALHKAYYGDDKDVI